MPTISVARRAAPGPTDHTQTRFTTQWLGQTTAVIDVHGELDASNAAALTEYGMRQSRPNEQLVLDLSGVTFFGASCFACLHTLNVHCAGLNIDWAVIPSSPVARVVRICDPAGALPLADGMQGALSRLRKPPDLQLVGHSS